MNPVVCPVFQFIVYGGKPPEKPATFALPLQLPKHKLLVEVVKAAILVSAGKEID
jgi:hypothetical protein